MPPTIDPSALSSPSPSPMDTSGPPRKRPRSEMSSEERKEARAHRNRIAAQNSRDRRKAQFSFLERKVADLEEENRQLRISIGLLSQGQPAPIPLPISAPTPVSIPVADDLARDRENAELKERIRTLERGWDAVVKALAAQGLPTGLTPPQPQSPQSPAAAFPSPAPTHSSLDFDSPTVTTSHPSTPVLVPTSSTSTSPISSPRTLSLSLESPSPTRGPAAGGLVTSFQSFDEVDSMGTGKSAGLIQQEDEQAMEELLREILVPVPPSETVNTSTDEGLMVKEDSTGGRDDGGKSTIGVSLLSREVEMDDGEEQHQSTVVDWANEIEMQRLLDSLQQSTSSSPSAITQQHLQEFLGVDPALWNDFEASSSTGVDVF